MSKGGCVEDLDALGLLCPLPVLKIRKKMKGMAPGARLRVLADDPAAAVDIPHFCNEQGHVLVETEDLGFPKQAYVVERGAG